MKNDEIKVGKSYRMRGSLDRHVLDILSHPAGDKFCQEYREVILEVIGGKHPGRCEKQSLEWFAYHAAAEIQRPGQQSEKSK